MIQLETVNGYLMQWTTADKVKMNHFFSLNNLVLLIMLEIIEMTMMMMNLTLNYSYLLSFVVAGVILKCLHLNHLNLISYKDDILN